MTRGLQGPWGLPAFFCWAISIRRFFLASRVSGIYFLHSFSRWAAYQHKGLSKAILKGSRPDPNRVQIGSRPNPFKDIWRAHEPCRPFGPMSPWEGLAAFGALGPMRPPTHRPPTHLWTKPLFLHHTFSLTHNSAPIRQRILCLLDWILK